MTKDNWRYRIDITLKKSSWPAYAQDKNLKRLRMLIGAIQLIFDLPWLGESVMVCMKQFVTPRHGRTHT